MSMTRNLLTLALTAAALSLSAGAHAADPAKKEIVFGATAGPYSDQIKLGIKPILEKQGYTCLLYTSPSPRDKRQSRMPSSA